MFEPTDVIMVRNPVAELDASAELPNLTEHVPVDEASKNNPQ